MDHLSLLQTIRYLLLDHPQIRHFQWDPATTFGGSTTFVASAVTAYLTLTLILSRFFNPSLPAAFLRLISVVHNMVLLVLSLFMVLGMVAASLTSFPVSHLICFPAKNPRRQGGPLFFWTYVYYLSKLVEFIDTLLIILNKNSGRRLTFLHVYHHAMVLVMSYLWITTTAALFPIGLMANAGVHVLMYSYYMLCAMGIRPSWKRLVTDVQIVQFVVGFMLSPVMLYFHFRRDGCAGMSGWCFNAVFNSSLLYLFVDFHKSNYADKKNKMKIGAAANKQS